MRIGIMIFVLALATLANGGVDDGRLDIYFIDTEGGAATLIVTPAGESVLVDCGNPGTRDAARIVETARRAKLTQIDHLVITHYHADHFGGAAELARLLPIRSIYDNGDENPSRDRPSQEYLAIKSDRRVVLNPGDLLPLKPAGQTPLEIKCLAARKKLIDPPAGAAQNPFCGEAKGKPMDLSDNANSIVLLLSFGDFRFFDGGDLTWNIEHDLACPVNRAGTVDVYQVTHHGLAASNNPVLVKALAPTVAIMNNGHRKGCDPETFATLKSVESLQSIFQVHRNLRADGDINNTSDEFIANTTHERECRGNGIELHVSADASSYEVAIPATNTQKTYQTRRHDE